MHPRIYDRPLAIVTCWGLGLAVVAVMLFRLASLDITPLMDTTEARYAEVARLMLSKSDWITPWFDNDTPFWGKPPLAFWAQALSMQGLSISPFAARFPAWLAMAAVALGCVLWWRRTIPGMVTGWAVLILLSSALGLVAAGAVMTDAFLLLGVVVALHGLWLAGVARAPGGWWRIALGAAIGTLAKGPLAVVILVGTAVPWWCWSGRGWRELRYFRPGISLLLYLGLTLPWFVAAELKTPGFLNYFLIGEHWHRFTDPGWAGDRFGSAHERVRGTIWLYLLAALLPWSVWLPWRKAHRRPLDDFQRLLWCWALVTPLLFTLSGNILWTYVLPSLPAWAVLIGIRLSLAPSRTQKRVAWAAVVAPLALTVAIVQSLVVPSQRHMEPLIILAGEVAPEAPLFVQGSRRFSADFHSRGTVHWGVPKIDTLEGDFLVAVPESHELHPDLEALCQAPLATVSTYRLLSCQAGGGAAVADEALGS